MNPKFNPKFSYIKNVPNIKENTYLISKTGGRLYSLYKERVYGSGASAFVVPYIDKDEYERVSLISQSGTPRTYTKGNTYFSNFNVQRKSSTSHLKDPTVNHIDGNTLNNNNIDNLEWIERADNSNIQYRKHVAGGMYNAGNIYPESTIKEIIDTKIKHPKLGCSELHRRFKVSRAQIFRIVTKKIWKYLTDNVDFNMIKSFSDTKLYNWGYKNETDELSVHDIGRSTKTNTRLPEFTFFDNGYSIEDLN